LNILRIVEKWADETGIVLDSDSKRFVSYKRAKMLISESKIPIFIVSKSKEFKSWEEIIKRTSATHIQLHSNIKSKIVDKIKTEFDVFISKTFFIPENCTNPVKTAEKIENDILEYEVDRILLDTGYGSGKIHDLRVSRILSRKFDVTIGGGINVQNVREIIDFVEPSGVDVSSGVEYKGRKNPNLIMRLCEEIRNIKR
jgi:phosphoribosylanthranilate isomerase